MASIEQRPTSWRARVRRRGAPDISLVAPDRETAERLGRECEAAIQAGALERWLAERATRAVTFGDLLDQYAQLVTPGKKSATSERSRIRALKASRLGSLSLANLSRRELRAYRDARAGTGVNRDLALVSTVLKWGRAERDLEVDPAIVAGLKRRESPARSRRLLPGELEKLTAPGDWLAHAVTFLVETGLRRGELAALRWRDVDLGRSTATLETTKNGDRDVEVPLSSRALAALQGLGRGIGNAPVLAMHPDALSHRFAERCRANGISGLRLHDLRAECVSRLFERGLTLPEVRAISRHKSAALLRYVRSGDAESLARKLG